MENEMKKNKEIFKTNLPGFSLIEMAVVLSILGLLLGGVLKGRQLYDSAKLNALITQIQDVTLSIHQFEQNFGALPGDFSSASGKIKDTLINGDGNGLVENEEKNNVWPHLAAAGLIPSSSAPIAKTGGEISFSHTTQDGTSGHWIIIGEKAPLTPEQAFTIDKKIDSGMGNTGKVRGVKIGDKGDCINSDGSYNISNKNHSCVLYISY